MKLSIIAAFIVCAIAAALDARPVLADQPMPSPSPSPTTAAVKVLDTIVPTASRHTPTIRAASRETFVITSGDLSEFA